MVEIWDLYDRDGNKTGETFERGFGNYKNIPEGRYHLVVDILVLHEDGTYLLTKRSDPTPTKETCKRVSRLLAGWINYFLLADMKKRLQDLWQWVKGRIRAIIYKKWKKSLC